MKLHLTHPVVGKFDIELDDEDAALLEKFATSQGMTIDEAVEHIIQDFVGSHPIIEQGKRHIQ